MWDDLRKEIAVERQQLHRLLETYHLQGLLRQRLKMQLSEIADLVYDILGVKPYSGRQDR